MNNILAEMDIEKCNLSEIKPLVADYYIKNEIIIDSCLEGHIRESNCYKILFKQNIIGYFAIHKETVLVSFNIFDNFRNLSQELFAIIRKYETVKEALIPTGDEFFISHAIDNYTKIDKQAYFSIFMDKNPNKIITIELKLADIEKDKEILNLCEEIDNVKNKKNEIDEEIYIAKHENNIIGFGIIDYQKIVNIYMPVQEGIWRKYTKWIKKYC